MLNDKYYKMHIVTPPDPKKEESGQNVYRVEVEKVL
jgi:hypothetical protein